jgi:hypothetical protein
MDIPPHPGIRDWRYCSLITECLELSLRYVYGRMDLEALFCAFGRPPKNAVSEVCRFERDELVVEYRDPWGPRQIVRRYPYDRIVVFETLEGGAQLVANLDRYRAGVLYAPEVRIERAGMPPRARAMLLP